jgi:hypothetical protein
MTAFLLGRGIGVLLGAVGYKVVPVLVRKLTGKAEEL